MCVCAYVRMCVCAYVRMCVCAYVRMCVCWFCNFWAISQLSVTSLTVTILISLQIPTCLCCVCLTSFFRAKSTNISVCCVPDFWFLCSLYETLFRSSNSEFTVSSQSVIKCKWIDCKPLVSPIASREVQLLSINTCIKIANG
jgi:hypothetical protein